MSLIDFTDSKNPVEIGFFDRGPIHEDALILGGYWSTYWYNGLIYGTEIVRGLDVFALEPSEFLSENEIAAAQLASQGEVFNPQQQFPVTWPADPVVARAYMDQLNRSSALDPALQQALDEALDSAASTLADGRPDRSAARSLRRLADDLDVSGNDGTAQRMAALAETLSDIAERLRSANGN